MTWTRSPRRRGVLVAELIGAILLIGVAMVLTVRILGWVAAERQAAERRQYALLEAENALERIASLPWAELDESNIRTLSLNRRVAERLPAGRMEIAVGPAEGKPESKRVRVGVYWRGRSGLEVAPVRLSAWFPREAAKP